MLTDEQAKIIDRTLKIGYKTIQHLKIAFYQRTSKLQHIFFCSYPEQAIFGQSIT